MQAVDILLRNSVIDVDAGVSHIPIHAAVIHGYTDIVTGLLAAGCNVNKVTVSRFTPQQSRKSTI